MQFSKGFRGVWIAPLVIAADRLCKAWAASTLPGRGSVKALPGLLNWHYAENTGAAFSSMSSMTGLLSLVTLILVAAVCAFLLRRPDWRGSLRCGLWMLAAGGASNLFDRVVYGHVVDFIEFAFVRFAVFNIADVFICVGAGLTVLGYFMTERRQKEKEEAHG